MRFGPFELDVRSRELRNGDIRARLQEQPFEILRMMLERPGDVVTREELRQRLLEGSVRREGDRVRVTARLVEAAPETHLWAETYERHLTDCLAVQADVAARIAESLTLELAPDRAAPSGGASTSVSAYQEYLKGRYHWNNYLRPDDEGLDRAQAHYIEAYRLDPRFAPAQAGLARVQIARAVNYRDRPRTALDAARGAAKQALDLDSRLSEAHLAFGDVRRMLEWDWRGAEAAYLAAIALNPSQENAHRGYGTMLAMLGRADEAVRELERASDLDPLCLVVSTAAAWVCYLAGEYERAVVDSDPALPFIAVEPRFAPLRGDARYARLVELMGLT